MGKSSKDKRDIYYRLAKEQGWRARSAFKLLQIQETFNIFRDVKMVVDLCAAPGSWSQVLSRQLYSEADRECASTAKIVAVDLQLMTPIEGVIQLQGDITDPRTAEQVIGYFDGQRADLVVCDGAPDVIGLVDIDEYIQHQLVMASLDISTRILKTGGTMVAKVFRGPKIAMLTTLLSQFFGKVTIAKPKCSRDSSLEAFAVCEQYTPPIDFTGRVQDFLAPMIPDLLSKLASLKPVPFVACGGEEAYDADRTYPLTLKEGEEYQHHAPVQPPIHPPYELAQKMRKEGKLASQNTG
ncbi:putative tRNA (cytidine(32)/guanosine(34)-2'-O)-methyltransferase isoform X2 [Paramacrobiotus metropolitanus]|uniref:putative tRNA (cytidine(32)/guanosine(34)-2'-O)-methyltransferase isoform X2 n=1 Tax=Paramacrobiotus metropolitanus TaxID=2943436 RepID=UPI002445DFEF|nr:putative tRNA (cytidine(32)/guanosine(34)-2'-O)-methyltransferase isoform X2 [Paramacrobiotus metropolitanus]XP_055343447.1 putative tRNA (cytidine(32)/guanosine(34)-2'-O)-methyltransferase isoform X2 [Paramacrobiotus metropolitanus]